MAQKKKNSSKKIDKSKKDSKVTHKQKIQDKNVSNTVSKKTKASMKKSLSKFYLDKKPPSRYTPQQIEERRQYIRNTILKGNQQFQEDFNSQWYSDHSNEDCSSSTPLYQLEGIKEVPNSCQESSSDFLNQQRQQFQQQLSTTSQMQEIPQCNRHVSFSDDEEIHILQVDRAPPGRDNPIFDTKKTWITQLMSKKPKKSSIKIQVDKKGRLFSSLSTVDNNQYNQKDFAMQHFHQDMNIDSSILIDYDAFRVLYQENKQSYFVNTHFSYTQ
ncbi:hypothetical protein ABPG72_000877 [Tetrahymena utriculariae]